MSEKNNRLVRRIQAGWARGEMWVGKECYADDVLVTTDWPDASDSIRGVEALTQYMLDFLRQWESWRVEADRFTELSDDNILVEGRTIGIGAGSGLRTESPWFCVWILENGRVRRFHVHHDRDLALEAAGLSE